MELSEYEEAIQYFDKSIELDNTNSDAYFNKTEALELLKKYKEADICFNKVLELKPNESIQRSRIQAVIGAKQQENFRLQRKMDYLTK
jgi:tetratricopeptide (TPR) repeat protein